MTMIKNFTRCVLVAICIWFPFNAAADLAYTDANFDNIVTTGSNANEFRATFDVEMGGVKVAEGEIVANNFTGLFVGNGLLFTLLTSNVGGSGELLRLRMDSGPTPDGVDPASSVDVSFEITPLAGYGSVGASLGSRSTTLAVDNINDLNFTGSSATIQDDESEANLIAGATATPVAFVSGADVDFLVANWDVVNGFASNTHRQNWSVDVVKGVEMNFTYLTGMPINLSRDELAWGVEIEPVVDMKITKSVDEPSPDVGSTVTFTVMVENIGVMDASDVVVTDIVPSGFIYVPGSITGGDSSDDSFPSSTGLTWTIDDFIVGDPAVPLSFDAVVGVP